MCHRRVLGRDDNGSQAGVLRSDPGRGLNGDAAERMAADCVGSACDAPRYFSEAPAICAAQLHGLDPGIDVCRAFFRPADASGEAFHLSRTASTDRGRGGQTDPVIGSRAGDRAGHCGLIDRAITASRSRARSSPQAGAAKRIAAAPAGPVTRSSPPCASGWDSGTSPRPRPGSRGRGGEGHPSLRWRAADPRRVAATPRVPGWR